MKHIYSFLFLILIYLPGYSQDFAPVGAEWTLGYETPGASSWVHTFKTVNVIGEQMKEGKLCRVITGQIFPHSPSRTDTNFLYNENNAVYVWHSSENMFQKVFDFNAQVNDTWDIFIQQGYSPNVALDTFRVHVDSVFTEQIGGVSTNSYIFSLDYMSADSIQCAQNIFGQVPDYSMTGLKANSKLGSGYYIFPIMNNTCIIDPYPFGELHQHMRCYTDEETNYSNLTTIFGTIPSCDYQTIGMQEIPTNEPSIKVHSNSIRIDQKENSTYKISLYNIQGQQITKSESSTSLDVSGIQEGVYILHLQNETVNISKKIKL